MFPSNVDRNNLEKRIEKGNTEEVKRGSENIKML